MRRKPDRLSAAQSVPFALLLLVGLIAFYFTSGERLPLIAAGSVALSEVIRLRLPHSRLLAGALRLGVFTPIVAHLGIPPESFPQWYLKPSYTTLVGCLLSAEAGLRAWEPPGGLLTGDQRGVMFFISALLMAGAANTGERYPFNLFAPIYVLFALLALRSFEGRPWRPSVLHVIRLCVITIVIYAGLQLATSITRYDDTLNGYIEQLLYRRRPPWRVGMSSSPRLGRVFNPQPTMDRVMLVDGSISERYLAVAEFDRYQVPNWSPDVISRPYVSTDPRELRTNARGTTLTFTRIGSNLNMLPMPLNSASIESIAGVERDEFGALRHTEQGLTGGNSVFTAVVPNDELAQGPRLLPLLETQRKAALQLPDNFDSRAVELSRRITEGGTDRFAVYKLVNHLRSQHGYSLRYEPEGVEPISAFIMHKSSAHCVYFASALVMMCRASGIPARMVSGYYAFEPFTSNSLVVRERDAHAWAEAWVDGIGWISVDATPASGRPDQIQQRSSWIRRVGERVSDWPGYFRDWISTFSTDAIIVVVCGFAGLLFVAFVIRVLLVRRRGRAGLQASAYITPDKRLTAAARQFDRWLAHQGNRCGLHQTWRQCLHTVPQATKFIDAYERARYGAADEAAIAAALRELRDLRLQRLTQRRRSTLSSISEDVFLGR